MQRVDPVSSVTASDTIPTINPDHVLFLYSLRVGDAEMVRKMLNERTIKIGQLLCDEEIITTPLSYVVRGMHQFGVTKKAASMIDLLVAFNANVNECRSSTECGSSTAPTRSLLGDALRWAYLYPNTLADLQRRTLALVANRLLMHGAKISGNPDFVRNESPSDDRDPVIYEGAPDDDYHNVLFCGALLQNDTDYLDEFLRKQRPIPSVERMEALFFSDVMITQQQVSNIVQSFTDMQRIMRQRTGDESDSSVCAMGYTLSNRLKKVGRIYTVSDSNVVADVAQSDGVTSKLQALDVKMADMLARLQILTEKIDAVPTQKKVSVKSVEPDPASQYAASAVLFNGR